MNGKAKKWIFLSLPILIVAILSWSNLLDDFFKQIKQQPEQERTAIAVQSKKDEGLRLAIKEKAKQISEQPVNAVIDRVWKAIPGYNGIRLDEEKTFELSKSKKDNQISFVYEELPPVVGLDDLPPHPIYKGNPKKHMVSLMINVAWGDEFIPTMLQTLEDAHVKATFFLDGTWLSKNKETALEMKRRGHELSNHAYSHKNMSQLSNSDAIEEISKTEKLLNEIGVHNKLFAPPSGDFNDQTVLLAHELGLCTVLWTIDTVDWKKPKPEWILQKVTRALEPGSMILMHPTSSSSEALPQLIQMIKSKGFVLDTVSELISPKRVMNIEPLSNF